MSDEELEVGAPEAPPAQPAPIENLAGIAQDLYDAEAQENAEFSAAMAQSVSGQHLGPREYAMAGTNVAPWAAANPTWDTQWQEWAEQSADRLGWITDRLANGVLPAGPPSKYADELAAVDRKHAALREIKTMDPLNSDPAHQRRLQGLYLVAYGDEPITGRGGRTA